MYSAVGFARISKRNFSVKLSTQPYRRDRAGHVYVHSIYVYVIQRTYVYMLVYLVNVWYVNAHVHLSTMRIKLSYKYPTYFPWVSVSTRIPSSFSLALLWECTIVMLMRDICCVVVRCWVPGELNIRVFVYQTSSGFKLVSYKKRICCMMTMKKCGKQYRLMFHSYHKTKSDPLLFIRNCIV